MCRWISSNEDETTVLCRFSLKTKSMRWKINHLEPLLSAAVQPVNIYANTSSGVNSKIKKKNNMWQTKAKKKHMQVRAKDSKHLFSIDNLLDFLHKKADITDCLKQHVSVKNPWHLLYENEAWKKKKKRGGGNMWKWNRQKRRRRMKQED